jgi:MFS family permease
LPPDIWALGVVSLFMDASSELVHSLLPVFMVSVLGATVMTVGVIEGVAEATASISKLLSGALSDSLRRRKPLVVAGYGLAAVTKPLFPLASSMTWVFVARFVDRVGKGLRGAPRDALVADITPPRLRGAAFGLRQALDSVGAFAGPLLALLLMWWFGNDIRAVLWAAVVPAFVAVAVLVIFVREPPRAHSTPQPLRFSAALVSQLPVAYWAVVLLGGVFTLARFSEAFLLLRAQDVGLSVGHVPGVLIVMNVVYAGIAYPAGVAADRIGRYPLLVAGLGVLVAADLVLAFATVPRGVFFGAALWGAHMGLTQGLFSKLVADTAPSSLRGAAFGMFHLATALALFLASALAGGLWTTIGPSATFIAGSIFAGLAIVGLGAQKASRPSASAD